MLSVELPRAAGLLTLLGLLHLRLCSLPQYVGVRLKHAVAESKTHRPPLSATMPDFTTQEPPEYSPSTSTPTYSSHPRDDEERLAITTRDGLRVRAALGAFKVHNKRTGISLQVFHEEEHGGVPSFGRGALIGGSITIENTNEEVFSISGN